MDQLDLQVFRSLLQKAVRRGEVKIVEKVVKYLLSIGDIKWLGRRLTVIIYEECWTIGDQITDCNILEQYKNLTLTVKNKDAAGLATLAAKYNEGNWSALRGTKPQRDAITSVANAIKNPDAFWSWVKGQKLAFNKHHGRIKAAKVAVSKANFETDKAMMFAAAYFAVKDEIPITTHVQPQQSKDFPYWIAYDKHTSEGKEIIIEACQKINIYASRGMQLAFYFEGALCNQLTASPYWHLSKDWQIENMGYTDTQADIIWNKLKPEIIELTKKRVEELRATLDKPIANKVSGDQLSLL